MNIIGTTLILIASNAFTKYKRLTGAVNDAGTGLLRVTSTQFANLKTLNFVIAGVRIFLS
jgi:cathepsin E